jgi:hypothetical protein
MSHPRYEGRPKLAHMEIAMSIFREYALLIAVATPVAVVVLMNLYLVLRGESGTLLLPSLRRYPKIDIDAREQEAAEEALTQVVREPHVLPAAPAKSTFAHEEEELTEAA